MTHRKEEEEGIAEEDSETGERGELGELDGGEDGAGVEEGASERGLGGGTIGTEGGASGNRRKEISSTG
jgi:hypothetical protein